MRVNHTEGTTIQEVDDIIRLQQGTYTEWGRNGPQDGIFRSCNTSVFPENITYLGEQIDLLSFEVAVLNYYALRETFLPWQAFEVGFSNIWNENIGVLAENLTNAEGLTVIDDNESVTEKITGTSNDVSSSNSENRYTNTPNQYLTDNDGKNYKGLTDLTKNTGNATSDRMVDTERTLTTEKGGNKFERWLELARKNRNIQYEFFDKFKTLFTNTYVFYSDF